jgi:alpha-1,3/alpha-1,6-mannosyltransferase
VRVRGNTIVPPSVLGRLSILCAILRQIHLIFQIALFSSELSNLKPTVFFLDQLSAGIPLLRYLSPDARILFYCHFPDKLLTEREDWVKKLYRIPFDWIESWSTGSADTIVVNSNFTKGMFGKAFPALKDRTPQVVYPCVDTNVEELKKKEKEVDDTPLWEGKKIVLSINRFERKKDVGLAIKAYAGLSEKERENTRLVIAGMNVDPSFEIDLTFPRWLRHACSGEFLLS